MGLGSSTPEVGQIVRVRQRSYLVEQTSPPVNPSDSNRVALSCVDDDAQGQQLEVLWERELDATVLTAEAWDSIASRGFDPPDRFSAYLNTLRWNCVTSTDPSRSVRRGTVIYAELLVRLTTNELMAMLVATSFAAGLNIYATVATLGLLARFDLLLLLNSLRILENWWIIAVSIVLFVIEFFADKVTAFDLIWNALHAFVRVPIAGNLSPSTAIN